MQKNTKTNLILFVIALFLIATLVLVKEHHNQNDLIFLPIDIDKLDHIIIKQSPHIELQKVADGWSMLKPESGDVSKLTIQKILDMLSAPMHDSYEVDEMSLTELSLVPPNLEVMLDGEALQFGALSPIKQMHYVKFRNKVYLASPFLLVRFSASPKDLLTTASNDDLPDNNGHQH